MHPDTLYTPVFVTVHGADAATFLSGQCTQDVTGMREGERRLAAFCTPKGRAIAVAHIERRGAALRMETEDAVVETLLATLRRYVLRAKVAFEPEPGPAAPLALGAHLARVEAGQARVSAATSGEFVPQMLNLDLLGGIDFNKGCYTGQEIVARTHNLGTIKRRMLPFALDAADAAAPGMRVVDARGETVGQVADAAGERILAVVRLARLAEDLRVAETGARCIERLPLPYVVPELAG